MNDVAEWLKEGSGWTTDGVLEHYFNLVNYKPLEGKSYIPCLLYTSPSPRD